MFAPRGNSHPNMARIIMFFDTFSPLVSIWIDPRRQSFASSDILDVI